RQVVLTLATPLPGPVHLQVRIKHHGGPVGQALGRFRLSVTSGATPQRVLEIPARLRPILDVAVANRTDKQRTDLAALYRTVAPALKPARDRRADLQKALKALGIPSALVMRDRTSYERPSTYVRRRGNFMDKGQKVYANVPEVLPSLDDNEMPNRLGLAYWRVDASNPRPVRPGEHHTGDQRLVT